MKKIFLLGILILSTSCTVLKSDFYNTVDHIIILELHKTAVESYK